MNCTDTLSSGATASAVPFQPDTGAAPRLFSNVLQLVKVWRQRRHDRETLRQLPEYLLRDVGLDIPDAQFEADKPFWRA